MAYHLLATDMDVKQVWNVLKWILAALAAGFVGHFGRALAERLIAQRRKARRSDDHHQEVPPEVVLASEEVEARQKIDKKRLKAQQKAEKKRGDQPR